MHLQFLPRHGAAVAVALFTHQCKSLQGKQAEPAQDISVLRRWGEELVKATGRWQQGQRLAHNMFGMKMHSQVSTSSGLTNCIINTRKALNSTNMTSRPSVVSLLAASFTASAICNCELVRYCKTQMEALVQSYCLQMASANVCRASSVGTKGLPLGGSKARTPLNCCSVQLKVAAATCLKPKFMSGMPARGIGMFVSPWVLKVKEEVPLRGACQAQA